MFRHILIDEMQDTNTVQVALVETIAARRAGQPDGRRRRRPVDLPVPGGQLRQHPQVPRPAPRRPRSSGSRSTTARRPRSSPSPTPRSRTTRSGFAKTLVSARPDGRPPGGRPDGRRLRGGRLPLPADPRMPRAGRRRSAGWPSSTATTTTASCSRASWSRGGSPTRSGAACGSSSRPTSRTCSPTCGSSSTRATRRPGDGCCCSCPGIGPAKASALCDHLAAAADPLAALATAETMALVPAKSKGFFAGFVADLRKIQATDPETNPAAAIGAILKGGYPDDRPAQVRAARQPDRRHRAARRPRRAVRQPRAADRRPAPGRRRLRHGHARRPTSRATHLVLSTIHQAKGLEWSRVFVPRLSRTSFPNRRALDEPGGEDEERRIFYVAVTRAMDELYLTYPLTVRRGGRGPTIVDHPEPVPDRGRPGPLRGRRPLETEIDLSWSSGPKPTGVGGMRSRSALRMVDQLCSRSARSTGSIATQVSSISPTSIRSSRCIRSLMPKGGQHHPDQGRERQDPEGPARLPIRRRRERAGNIRSRTFSPAKTM